MERNLQDYIDHLKEHHVRITNQRVAMLEFLLDGNPHPTADEIYRALKPEYPSMSIATVYNNLKTFQEFGFVTEMTFGDGSSRFDLIDTPHYHMMCNRCGKIEDFIHPGLNDIVAEVEKKTNFLSTSHRFEVYGLCEECQKEIKKEKEEE